ncbi:hypothetical protein HII31_00316 [Pseudocercospora fuligena]|uniref:Thiaminase-2/PQQC domain-containing protein n=1 Tax=Pseudocercospora fuligena TaxID=685502 RepID=A0A8H6RX72_9PEZI|nr:hypothetical protein HII31_00316 [Pseudocercospora fuligena]
MLIECLVNIRREISLFEQTARDEGWFEEICEGCEVERETRNYQDLFAGATAQGRPVLVGLRILWATEECYLRAWRFGLKNLKVDESKPADVVQRVFIPNWSSAEFEAFVTNLGGLANKMATEWGVEEGGRVWKECEAAWKQVIWVKREFWPDVDENGMAEK